MQSSSWPALAVTALAFSGYSPVRVLAIPLNDAINASFIPTIQTSDNVTDAVNEAFELLASEGILHLYNTVPGIKMLSIAAKPWPGPTAYHESQFKYMRINAVQEDQTTCFWEQNTPLSPHLWLYPIKGHASPKSSYVPWRLDQVKYSLARGILALNSRNYKGPWQSVVLAKFRDNPFPGAIEEPWFALQKTDGPLAMWHLFGAISGNVFHMHASLVDECTTSFANVSLIASSAVDTS